MDCNQDEALRAKETAERKFIAKDIEGAKRFALKAKSLNPRLDGISQMIATLDVHLSSTTVVNGEKDWYSILGIKPSANEEMVKRRYRKFALMLHPDKNKSIGAEGAFKLISEAWSILSDRTRRMAYDEKRSIKEKQRKVPQPKRDPPFSYPDNGLYHFDGGGASGVRTQKNSSSHLGTPAVPHTNTFWTSCKLCRMQYEYLRVYLNHTLLCPNCHEPFLAAEIPFPSNSVKSSVPWPTEQCHQNPRRRHGAKNAHGPREEGKRPSGSQRGSVSNSHDNQDFQWAASSGAAGTAASFQTSEEVRRELKEGEAPGAKRAEGPHRKGQSRPAKRRSVDSDSGNGFTVDESQRKPAAWGGAGANASETEGGGNGFVGDPRRGRQASRRSGASGKEFPQVDIRSMLIQRAKLAVKLRLQEWNSAEVEARKQKQKQRGRNDGREAAMGISDDPILDKVNGDQVLDTMAGSDNPDEEDDAHRPITLTVPDPDFHDFDVDRSERSFGADQVWATYDDEDGMPRLYVMVQRVLSFKPFNIQLSFLNSKSTSEFGQLNWIGSGFRKTCGDFRVGRYEPRDTVNIFSHRVRWEKGPRGAIRILPQKGDVWAIYSNWSPDWSELTPDEVLYKYDMVEVVENYSEEGLRVYPLEKVHGFKAVFRRRLCQDSIRRIPREEMFCLSHQVPYHLLTGREAEDAPKGCYELDPAAIPLDLFLPSSEAAAETVKTVKPQEQASVT
ncbi:unnamed protein product [Spirodela intermedia]|uniref:J domain-containing protein n=1 Tax=Spirodela intermedia TaxID=51605 RepID=A0A7I8KRY1_SPIIN|nr:unnamed protein product [Spirodela intermedia]